MKPSYRAHRFPPEIISHAVWLYHRFVLSLWDVEDLLAERGGIVSHETSDHGARSSALSMLGLHDENRAGSAIFGL
jgi:transposase-like protein